MLLENDFEQKTNELFNLSAIASIIINRDGSISNANPATLALFDYDFNEIITLKIHDLIIDSEKEKFSNQFEVITKDYTGEIELNNTYQTKSGKRIKASLKAVLNNSDQPILAQLIDNTALINTGKALKESEERYRLLVENSPFCIHAIDKNGNISSMNPAGLKMLGGILEEEVCGIYYVDFVGDKDKMRIELLMQDAFNGNPSFFDFDVEVEGKNVYFKSNFVPIISPSGKVEKLMGVTQDVTEIKTAEEDRLRAEITKETNVKLLQEIEERKKVELELNKSIQEKKVLLKEIHHRVKNNLQLVSSLLKLQANTVDNEDFSNAIQESQNRIKSMALVHESLYQSKTLSEIDVEGYLNTLLQNKIAELIEDKHKVHFDIISPNIYFEIEQMLPIGLIVNELVTNSIKYALNDNNQCSIHIELIDLGEDKFTLSYKDDGPGLNQNFEKAKLQGLGMELVDSFVSQLDGSLKMKSSEKGLNYEIEFYNALVQRK